MKQDSGGVAGATVANPRPLDPADAGLDDAPGRVAMANQAPPPMVVDPIGVCRKKRRHLGLDRVAQHLASPLTWIYVGIAAILLFELARAAGRSEDRAEDLRQLML